MCQRVAPAPLALQQFALAGEHRPSGRDRRVLPAECGPVPTRAAVPSQTATSKASKSPEYAPIERVFRIVRSIVTWREGTARPSYIKRLQQRHQLRSRITARTAQYPVRGGREERDGASAKRNIEHVLPMVKKTSRGGLAGQIGYDRYRRARSSPVRNDSPCCDSRAVRLVPVALSDARGPSWAECPLGVGQSYAATAAEGQK